MRVLTLLLPILLGVSTAALAQPTDGTAERSADAEEPGHGPFLRLTTGEVLQGNVIPGEAVRGVPQFIYVDDTAYPNFRVHSYRTEDDVYGLAHIEAGRPMLVVRHQEGSVQIYREANRRDGNLEFFQIGSSPIRAVTSKNLRAAFEGHPEAMRHLDRERMYSTAGTGAFAVGVGLVLAGAAVQFGQLDGPWPSGVIIASTGVGFAALVNAIVPGARQAQRNAAIQKYQSR